MLFEWKSILAPYSYPMWYDIIIPYLHIGILGVVFSIYYYRHLADDKMYAPFIT